MIDRTVRIRADRARADRDRAAVGGAMDRMARRQPRRVSAAPMPATFAAKAADVWAVPVGIGHASPIVDGQRVYVFARKGEQEVAQAIDLATGKALWSAAYDQPYTMNSAATGHGKGPKSTPMLAGGRLFTLGISGVLSGSMPRPARSPGGIVRQGVRPAAGLRHGDVAALRQRPRSSPTSAVSAAAPSRLRFRDRRARWSWAGDGPGYASPVAIVAGGVRQIVTETQTKIVGVDAGDRRAALVAAVHHALRAERGDAGRLRRSGDPFGPRPVDLRGAADPRRRRQVDAGQGVGRQGVPDVHEFPGPRRRHRLRPDQPQQGPVLRPGR